jgi:multidrug efflux pump subunit AcrA (membrane-fusion protein)
LGVPLPEMDKQLPEDMEVEVSRMMAAAAAKLLQKDQAEMAQQQAMQAQQDPLVQMQQQELQLKAAEVDIKRRKLAMDAAAKEDQLEIERARLEVQERIAGVQAGVKAAAEKARLDAEMEAKGFDIGSRIAKDRMELQRPQPPKKKG